MNSEVLQEFKQMLLLVDWDSVTILQNSKVVYNRVLEICSGFYDIAFPKENFKIRDKALKRSWKLKGLQECTNRKQKLNTLEWTYSLIINNNARS